MNALFLLLFVVLMSACTSGAARTEAAHDHASDEDAHEHDHDDDTHQEEEVVVTLSSQARDSSDIKIAPIERRVLNAGVTIPAEIALNPDHVAHINPLVEGQLLDVQAKLGERVIEGQELARLRSVALGQARAELARTRAIDKVAQQTLDRQKALRSEGINSQRRLLEAQLAREEAKAEHNAARSRLKVFGSTGGSGPDMALKSPISGLVLERHATRGESVTPQDTLFVIADLSTVWVIGKVYVQHMGDIKQGMSAQITFDAYPEHTWNGKIDYIASQIDESTRTLPVRIELSNEEELLKPGMYGRVVLNKGNASDKAQISVPESALLEVKGKPVVFVPEQDGTRFRAISVVTGTRQAGRVEILSGLESTSQIVVQGGFILKSELMRAELGHGHAH